MNIDEMSAGPEMDLLIAVKVMGWEDGALSDPVARAEGDWINRKAIESTGNGRVRRSKRTFHPSGNIAHAWEVAERIRALSALNPPRTAAELEELPEKEKDRAWEEDWIYPWVEVAVLRDDGYTVTVFHSDDEVIARSEADTAPLAICRAALKAVSG